MAMTSVAQEEILDQFLGDEAFPIHWESDLEKGLFWVFDDLHCPQALSPMFFGIGGWWLSREFGIPAVVGTSVATERIGSGDRIRVNGSTGVVEILETGARPETTCSASSPPAARRGEPPVSEPHRRSEKLSAGRARLRVDVFDGEPREHVLEDMSFLNYRLADVRVEPKVTLAGPDIVWHQDADKDISFEGRVMTFRGPWAAGPIQKVTVALLALRMEAVGLHPFHASAVRYRDRTVMFLGGESNHGKSMGQIEACRRGALLVSTETTVVDEEGRAVMGSKAPFIKRRTEGTERADKAAPERGVEKFFGAMPVWDLHTEPSSVDVVIVPAIDGNFDPSLAEMIPFERQFQTLHSLQNYFLLNELLAPGFPMPIVDTEPLRRARAAFVARFCERPYWFVRAATPQVLMDQVEEVL